MRVDVISVMPQMFDGPMGESMIGIARERGILELHVHDLRIWTEDKHRTTDDTPYGGGPGMVMKPEPVFRALREVVESDPREAIRIVLSPRGERFDQRMAEEFSDAARLLFICGRYEGLDERIFSLADRVVSVGDYVLTGGELAAMVMIDATTRLLPGVLGDDGSAAEESFTTGLLEYPQYTRPAVFEHMAVPEVLRSGDHAAVARWRREQAIRMTARMRPDLIEAAALSDAEMKIAREELERSNTP